jgi:hypothetical protein
METDTFHFVRVWGFPVDHKGTGEPVGGTSGLLWAVNGEMWSQLIPSQLRSPVFRNPVISIETPTKEDRWIKSLRTNVSWMISNTVLESLTVELHCFDLHPRTLISTIASNLSNTLHTASWTVPNGLPSSSRYAIRIWGHEASWIGTAQVARKRELVEAVGQFFSIESYKEPRKSSADSRVRGWWRWIGWR